MESLVDPPDASNAVNNFRKLGIAGLFSNECDEIVMHIAEEPSRLTASPGIVVREIDPDGPYPWEFLDDELDAEEKICAAARTIRPINGEEEYIPAMPCTRDEEPEPHRPNIAAFNSHSWIVVNACVARPVGR